MRTLRIAFLSSAVLEFFASVAIAVAAMVHRLWPAGYIQYGPGRRADPVFWLVYPVWPPEFFQPPSQPGPGLTMTVLARFGPQPTVAFARDSPGPKRKWSFSPLAQSAVGKPCRADFA